MKGQRTIQVPMLTLRAAVAPASISEEARTVDLVFSTGVGIVRYDWGTGERYIETLSIDPAHIRLERLNNGAPLLDSHSSWSVRSQLGVVVDGSAKVVKTKSEARATVQFSRRDDVEPIWQDVRDRVVRNVSVGYLVHKFEETRAKEKIPTRRAIDWEPFEISMVPMGADPGAKARNERVELHACLLLTRESEPCMPITDADRERWLRLQLAKNQRGTEG